ncbi:hypothetical protein KQI30_06210 [Clostridium bornimense]|uniref:hypothetical protein n=1 Tax=Clostridium bornimense TaxID=1216932 RepID=UPI001C0F8F96|nr:hypothetical protein [Clostridium bornimense]MBU5315857.1 hypothetical protein [Clostridium bornimense]
MEKKRGLGWNFVSSLVDIISIAIASAVIMVLVNLVLNFAGYKIVSEYKVYANFLCYVIVSLLYLTITPVTKLKGTIGNFFAAKIIG